MGKTAKNLLSKGKQIQQFTFELRFEPAYMLWDSSGKIWTTIQKNFPVVPGNVHPNSVQFKVGGEFDVSFELNKVHVIWVKNKKTVKDFHQLSDMVAAAAKQVLKIDAYTRVGSRFIYLDETEDLNSATTRLNALGLIPVKTKPFFNIQGTVEYPEFACRWGDDDIGLTVRTRIFEQTYELELPPALSQRFEETRAQVFGVQYDVDYFTKKNVVSADLNASEWLRQNQELVERDLDSFLKVVHEK